MALATSPHTRCVSKAGIAGISERKRPCNEPSSTFNSAIEFDPTYADALSGLSEVQTTLGLYGVLSPHEIMPRAKASATQALAIDPELSAPLAVLGCLAAV